MMPAIQKAFDLMGDDVVELSTKNDCFQDKLGSYDRNAGKNLKQNSQNILMMKNEQI